MLSALTVRNLVVVRDVEIDFEPGLTVLTGETGSGKSVLIEALGLALGERADQRLIRVGAERADVAALFDISELAPVRGYLEDHALDDGAQCLLRRVLARDGRSRAYCNGTPVNVQTLRDLGALLVDIHSQHASHRLMQRDHQRHLLDAYGNHDEALVRVREAWQAWQAARLAIDELIAAGKDAAAVDLLRYQVEELEAAHLDSEELQTLEADHKRLADSAEVLEACAGLRRILEDEAGGAGEALGVAQGQAASLLRVTPDAGDIHDLLEQAAVLIGEAGRELDRLEDRFGTDPERFQALDRRLSELHALARKHHVTLLELPAHADALAERLAEFDRYDQEHERLETRLAGALDSYEAAVGVLRSARLKAARRMGKDISARLRELDIEHARFEIDLAPLETGPPQAHGRDLVEFKVTTNPKHPPEAITKVASGGELSRIGLAIQAATARHSGVPVMVYDEVDTGIGGTTATTVGRNLREVAAHCQVVCITHSAQVASAGDAHVLVDKSVVEGQAETALRPLVDQQREDEIARMLGAAQATGASRQHARDLLDAARAGEA